MAQQIVGVRGLLNPQWLERRELPDHARGGGQIPLLIGVEHEGAALSGAFSQHGSAAQVTVTLVILAPATVPLPLATVQFSPTGWVNTPTL